MVASTYVREVEEGDAEYIGTHLRQGDRDEIMALRGDDVDFIEIIRNAVAMSSHCWTGCTLAGEPVSMFGAAAVPGMPGVASPWALATERLFDFQRETVLEGLRYINLLRSYDYALLVNYVDARNKQSIRWLKRLGFTIHAAEPFGVKGYPFHRFEMRVA